MKKFSNPLSMINKKFEILTKPLPQNILKILIFTCSIQGSAKRMIRGEISNIITKFIFSFNFSFYIKLRVFHLIASFFHLIPPTYPAKKSQYTSFIVSDAIIANESGEITVIKIDFFRPHFLLFLLSFHIIHRSCWLAACNHSYCLLFLNDTEEGRK